MPSAVWWEWWPTPTVPVPMARRLVWMPVLPRVTVSAAVNLRESAGRVRACRANTPAGKKAAPAAQAVRWRNSRRFMGPPTAACRCWLSIISTREQSVRLSVAEGGMGTQMAFRAEGFGGRHRLSLTIYLWDGIYVERLGGGMPIEKSDLLQGTLDMLILKIVELGPVHGYGISQRIRQISKEVLQVQQGSLYPALHRLEKRGWLAAEWGESDNGRQAKFYKLSAKGRKQLASEESNWHRLAGAVGHILQTAD